MLVKPTTVASFVDNPPMATSTPCFGVPDLGGSAASDANVPTLSPPKPMDISASPASKNNGKPDAHSTNDQRQATEPPSAPSTANVAAPTGGNPTNVASGRISTAQPLDPNAQSTGLSLPAFAAGSFLSSGCFRQSVPTAITASIPTRTGYEAYRPPTDTGQTRPNPLTSDMNRMPWGHSIRAPMGPSGICQTSMNVGPAPSGAASTVSGGLFSLPSLIGAPNRVPRQQENVVTSSHAIQGSNFPQSAPTPSGPNAHGTDAPLSAAGASAASAITGGATPRVDTTSAVDMILRSQNSAFHTHPLFPLLQDIHVILQVSRLMLCLFIVS